MFVVKFRSEGGMTFAQIKALLAERFKVVNNHHERGFILAWAQGRWGG